MLLSQRIVWEVVGVHEDDTEGPASGALDALRAMTHVTRLRMCAVLAGGPASAAELARGLALQHAAASYHLRVLRDAGVVTLAEERTVNGGVERRYGMAAPPDEPAGGAPSTTEDWIALVATVGALQQQRAARVSTDPKWFDDVEVWVPPEALARARELMDIAFAHLRGAAVPPSTDGTVPISASALLFALRRPDRSDDLMQDAAPGEVPAVEGARAGRTTAADGGVRSRG